MENATAIDDTPPSRSDGGGCGMESDNLNMCSGDRLTGVTSDRANLAGVPELHEPVPAAEDIPV